MKLYYAPGACSLSPHIVAREAGLDIKLVKVDLKSHKTESGGDFYEINPKGYVPVLQLEGGEIITENPAVVLFMAEQKPDAGLAPEIGSLDRYRAYEWLNYISAEVHKSFGPLFGQASEDQQEAARARIRKCFDYIESKLEKDYLLDDDFTAPDAYLFTVSNWLDLHKIDTSAWPKVEAYRQRIAARPAVQQAMKEEGLI